MIDPSDDYWRRGCWKRSSISTPNTVIMTVILIQISKVFCREYGITIGWLSNNMIMQLLLSNNRSVAFPTDTMRGFYTEIDWNLEVRSNSKHFSVGGPCVGMTQLFHMFFKVLTIHLS